MKTFLHPIFSKNARLTGVLFLMAFLLVSISPSAQSQIYEPEGLNMPGSWDSWTNPPANLALASSTQVTGGRVVKITTGTLRWQTILKVATTGGDLTGGSYQWLFTSGPLTSAFQNKWASVTVIMDSLQTYTKEGGSDNNITLEDNFFYTMNWEDIGYSDTRAIFMKTSAEPVNFTSVTFPSNVIPNTPTTVTIALSATPSPEQHIFARYSVDNWATSQVIEASVNGPNGTAVIPGQVTGTVVSFYVLSSTKPLLTGDYDLYTIRFLNDNGANFSYTTGSEPAVITYASIDHPATGSIVSGQSFDVFGNAGIPGITGQATPAAGLEAWIGWSSQNTDPSTWSNWMVANYLQPSGANDQFSGNLGASIPTAGRWYYAYRYRYNSGNYVYGGYGTTASGFWNGTTSISGVLDISVGLAETGWPGLKIYPNPVTDVITIETGVPSGIKITNITGAILISKEIPEGRQKIDLSGLAPGVYLLELTSGNRKVVQKIIH